MKFKAGSLTKQRVLNTRPALQAKKTTLAIEKAGGQSIELPLLAITPCSPDWLTKLPELQWIDYAIFISPNAVKHFFSTYPASKWPAKTQIFALGQGTAAALSQHPHLPHPIIASKPDSEHLLMQEALRAVNHKKILLIKGIGGRALLQDTLSARGGMVFTAEVYTRSCEPIPTEKLTALWHANAIDIILVTSETTLVHLFNLFGKINATLWLTQKTFIVLSERLLNKAKALGAQHILLYQKDI